MDEKYRYLVTIQFVIEDDNGKETKPTEVWLVNAVSVTDAETKTMKELEKLGFGGRTLEYRVKDVKETKITKVME